MSLNSDGVDPVRGGSRLEPGTYTGRVRNPRFITSTVKGTPGITVDLEVESGPFAGATIEDTLWLSEKALGMSKWKAESAGGSMPKGSFEPEADDAGVNHIRQSIDGGRVLFSVMLEPGQKDPTKSYPKVNTWDKASGNAPDLPGAPAGAAPVADDGDIPF